MEKTGYAGIISATASKYPDKELILHSVHGSKCHDHYWYKAGGGRGITWRQERRCELVQVTLL